MVGFMKKLTALSLFVTLCGLVPLSALSAVSTTGRDFANLHIIVLPSIVVLDRMGQPVAWLNGADAVSLLPALASPLLEE